MVEAVLRARSRRRRGHDRLVLAAARYAALGWPVCPGAWPPGRQSPAGTSGRACSCDRLGCPAPGAHPLSPAWKLQATSDPAAVAALWSLAPQAGILLATGRAFDVLDVPEAAGLAALRRIERAGVTPGPVATGTGERMLFFVASRAALAEDDEWWSCHLDCVPEVVPAVTGLRWHCRDSYVLAPPSRLPGGLAARWIIAPAAGGPLPDALRLLVPLADACEEIPQ
ncbi:MAG TPA: bifunctional DNA primase/polymerase [Streptosporangiaceae bacterium]|nr:bifunctional DNA primase/polymerase [Streptosporangiaceae bacterium]